MRETTIPTSSLVRAANALQHVECELADQIREAEGRAPDLLVETLLAEHRRTRAAREDLQRAAREQASS